VSPATVSRFARVLGFSDFQAMKAALRVDLLSPPGSGYPTIKESDSPEDVTKKVFAIAQLGMTETLAILEPDAIRRAAQAMAAAGKIEFYGVGGSSGPVATFAAYKFMNLGIITSARVDSVLQIKSAETLGKQDVAFGISHSGVATTVIAALRTAREGGAITVCLTNYAGSPITAVADIVLLTAIEREAPTFGEAIASRVPQICVLDSLYACMSLLAYADSVPDSKR
jgi:DNA-binding MurR/RpiR family transcriptional regulator